MNKKEFYLYCKRMGKYRVVRMEHGMGMVYDPEGFEMIHDKIDEEIDCKFSRDELQRIYDWLDPCGHHEDLCKKIKGYLGEDYE